MLGSAVGCRNCHGEHLDDGVYYTPFHPPEDRKREVLFCLIFSRSFGISYMFKNFLKSQILRKMQAMGINRS